MSWTRRIKKAERPMAIETADPRLFAANQTVTIEQFAACDFRAKDWGYEPMRAFGTTTNMAATRG